MSETTTATTQTLYPTMRYADARAAIDWLVNAFGFTEEVCYPAADGSVAHAQLRFGTGLIMIGSARDDDYPVKPPAQTGGLSGSIYVAVPAAEIEAHFARAKAAGAHMIREIRDTEYESREYAAYDLEGFLWSFGTYRP